MSRKPKDQTVKLKTASLKAAASPTTVKAPERQPRSVASTDSQLIKPYFRAGMHAELQKFGKSDDNVRQLLLGEDTDLQDPNSLDIYGLDLDVSEDKALHAIQFILDSTDYQGNIPGDQIQSSAFKFDGLLPRLSITYSDYYEAYGLKKIGGQYQGRQAQEALNALKSLTKTRRIVYQKRRRVGSGKSSRMVYDVVRVTRPLITLVEGFRDLDAEEASQVITGDLPQKRRAKLVIEVSPILVDQIDTFYLLKPTALHKEIQTLLPGKRISRSVSLFIEWLLTLDKPAYKISKPNLARKLRLDNLIKQRKQTLIDERIQEALQIAKDLEYLLDFREEPIGLLILSLNPERCKRIGMTKRGKNKQEAE